MKNKVPYNTKWLVKLLLEQYPKEIEIARNLKHCKEGFWKKGSKAYFYFVSAEKPNQQDSGWQFKNNIVLDDEKKGTIVIDILIGNKIGGIEFLKQIGK